MNGQQKILIIGASGAIGGALFEGFEKRGAHVLRASRSGLGDMFVDLRDEASITALACDIESPLDGVIVASGALHSDVYVPEKNMRSISAEAMAWQFELNTIGPALVAKHFIPLLNKDERSFLAILSARVGSISDNQLGGWYAYRAAKAALNMTIKNLAIETKRNRPEAVIVGLHPGTVDSELSLPFQKGVPDGKLFTPRQSADYLIDVIDGLSPDHSGKIFDWAGVEIEP